MSAIEKYDDDRDLALLERDAKVWANSKFLPERYQKKPDEIVVAGMGLLAAGVKPTLATLAQVWVNDGTFNMMAQLQMGIAGAHGLDCWFDFDAGDVDDDHATISIQKPGRERVGRYTYSIEMARKGELTDIWVERWHETQSGKKYPERYKVGDDRGIDDALVAAAPEWAKKLIDAGKLRMKDPWHKARQQMLMARATTMGLKVEAPTALLGIPTLVADPERIRQLEHPPWMDEETGEVLGSNDGHHDPAADDDIAEAELVEEPDGQGGGVPPKGDAQSGGAESAAPVDTPAEPATDEQKATVKERIAKLGEAWRPHISRTWQQAHIPSLYPPEKASKDYPAFTTDHLAKVNDILTAAEAKEKQTEDERRRSVNAELNKIGIKDDEARHAFIAAATDDETSSSAGLTGDQYKRIIEACAAAKAAPDDEHPAQQEALYADGEEPFA